MNLDYQTVGMSRREFSLALVDEQEAVLWGLRGDVFAHVAGFRLACRRLVCAGKFPAYAELSRRLTGGIGRGGRSRRGARLEGKTFATICRRLKVAVYRMAQSRLCIKPPKKEVFDDGDIERQRRAAIYTKQVAKLDALAAKWDEEKGCNQGPATKPIFCRQLDRWFQSAAEAARFINEQTGGGISRSDIRTAMKRRARCAGLRFSYEGPEEGKPSPMVMPTGQECQVVCVELGGPPFTSLMKAADFAGVSRSSLQKSINKGAKVSGYTFVYAAKRPAQKPENRPAAVRSSEDEYGAEQIGLFGEIISSARAPSIPRHPRKIEQRDQADLFSLSRS